MWYKYIYVVYINFLQNGNSFIVVFPSLTFLLMLQVLQCLKVGGTPLGGQEGRVRGRETYFPP